MRDETDLIVRRGNAQEREARAVGREARLDVVGQTRIDPAQRALGEGVHGDEAVVATGHDEGELPAVWGERERVHGTAHLEERLGLCTAARRDAEYLALVEKEQPLAIG